MLPAAWIMLIVFGVMSIAMLCKFVFSFVNFLESTILIISTILCALSASVIWGGFLSNIH